MRHIVRQVLVGVAMTLLLAIAVGTASAGRLSFSNQNIRATWTSLGFEAEGVEKILCPLTVEGSFHSRTIAKTQELIGYITKAIVKQESCIHGIGALFNGTERFNGTTTPNTLPCTSPTKASTAHYPE